MSHNIELFENGFVSGPVEIRTEHLPNKSEGLHRYTNPHLVTDETTSISSRNV
jgi:hypothetical protein